MRPVVEKRLRDRPRPAGLTGAAGELSTGEWHPRTVPETALGKLTAAVPKDAAAAGLLAAGHERVRGLLRHAGDISLGARTSWTT